MPSPTGTLPPPAVKPELRGPAMSDVVAAPIPNRSKPLRKPTHAEAKEKLQLGIGGGVVGLVIGVPLFYFGFKVIGGAILLLLCGGSLLIVSSHKDEVSDCPFCGAALHNLPEADPNGVPKPVQCRKCWEYSGLQKGFVSPYNPNAVEERPTFRSPLAQSVVWPNGCVQCGATPTRFDEVGTFAVNKGLLVVGAVRVKTFKLGGVPYCNAHKNAVEMKTEIGNRLFLDWRSLPMMRRYVAANRGRFTA